MSRLWICQGFICNSATLFYLYRFYGKKGGKVVRTPWLTTAVKDGKELTVDEHFARMIDYTDDTKAYNPMVMKTSAGAAISGWDTFIIQTVPVNVYDSKAVGTSPDKLIKSGTWWNPVYHDEYTKDLAPSVVYTPEMLDEVVRND